MMGFYQVTTLVLFSCLVTAISRILLKKGLVVSNALTGMVYSLFFGWIALFVIFLFDLKNQYMSYKGALFFSGIGLIAPPVVRYLTYIGVEKLGASRSDPIRSLTPLFALFFAFFFFNEIFSLVSSLACLLIVIGAYFLSQDAKSGSLEHKHFEMKDLLYPFAAAIVAGLVSNFRKIGMNLEITSVAAGLIAATSAIVAFSFFLLYKKNYKRIIIDRSSLKYLAATGVLVCITDIIDLIALKNSKVSVVAPILATTPLFVIIFSFLFLKNIEKITRNLIIGALFIFTGIMAIGVFKH